MTRVLAFLRRTRRQPRHRADTPPRGTWVPVPDTAAMVRRSRNDRTGREVAA